MNKYNEVLVSFKYQGHHGSVHAIYVMNLIDFMKIRKLQQEDYEIYLGEVEGKHSEVYVSARNFVLISKTQEDIITFKSMFGNTFGSYRPIDNALDLYSEVFEEDGEE